MSTTNLKRANVVIYNEDVNAGAVMSEVNESKIIIEVDEKEMGRFQILYILLGFLLAAVLLVPGFVFHYSAPFLFLLAPPGIVILSFWLWSVPSVFALRNPLKRIEIDPEDGKVTINDDHYDINEKVVYFNLDSGFFQCLPFRCTKLKVLDDERKTIKTYYTGSGTNKYAAGIRKKIRLSLLPFDALYKQKLSEEKVEDEYADGFGVVRIEFPATSIRNLFYKTGSLIFGFGLFALAFSYVPDDVLGKDPSQLTTNMILRFLSYLIMGFGLIVSLVFYFCYRKLAREIEIREDSIKINDEYFFRQDILSVTMLNQNTNVENTIEAEAWMCISTRKKRCRYYLGQTRNAKCFEPRRKLRNALNRFFGSVKNKA